MHLRQVVTFLDGNVSSTWMSSQWNRALAHCPFVFSARVSSSGYIEEANIEFIRAMGIGLADLKDVAFAAAMNVAELRDTLVGSVLAHGRATEGPCMIGPERIPCEAWAFPVVRDRAVVAAKFLAVAISPDSSPRPLRRMPVEAAPAIDHLKRYAAVAAHEIDNSLSAIHATAQLLAAIRPDQATVRRLAMRVETAAQNASLILEDLKVLGAPIRRETVININDIITEIADTRSAEIEMTSPPICLRLSDALPPILCDPGRLRQVLVNLIRNGLEAVTDKEKVPALVIKTRPGPGNTVVATVFNQGKPIPPKLHQRIFEPFFSTKADGSGLGLPICKEIIEEGHEGALDFRSSPRFGTVFRVTLPALPQ